MSNLNTQRLAALYVQHGGKCCYCGCATVNTGNGSAHNRATVEHVLDAWGSPSNRKIEKESNLKLSCYKCNNERGNARNRIARAYYRKMAGKTGKKIDVASTKSTVLFKMFGAVPESEFVL